MSETLRDKVIDDRECLEIVRRKLHTDSIDDFRLVDYDVAPVTEIHGLMGQYFTLKTTVAYPSTVTQTYNFFAKIPATADSPQYAWNKEFGSFAKELELYTKVFPEVMIGLEKTSIPECFLVDRATDKIVLDNMSEHGYSMSDKLIPFDFEHCRVVLKTLAKFHAKCVIFEENKKRNLYDEFSHCMNECLWSTTDGMAKRNFDAAVKGLVSLIDLMENIDGETRRKLKQRVLEQCEDHRQKLRPSTRFRNVICHGDLWANNILFKYDENGKPLTCCLVDFQLARYNPPAHDVLVFLQFSTTRSLRKAHSDDLFKIYWEELAESLRTAGLDASTIFPWTEFIRSTTELRTMCMIHGLLNITVILLEPTATKKYFNGEAELLESVFYVDRTPMIYDQFYKVPQYKERMLDALWELYESL